MVAGLPKDPIERVRSTVLPLVAGQPTSQRGVSRHTRSPDALADASLGTDIGGFFLRGEARSIGI